MFTGILKQDPIGNQIRGTSLYNLSHTANEDYSRCRRCSLSNGRRNTIVGFNGVREYNGEYGPPILFIGTHPRAAEDTTGIGFFGHDGTIAKNILKLTKVDFRFRMTYLVCCQTKDFIYDGDSSEDADHVPEIVGYQNLDRKPNSLEILSCKPHIDDIVEEFRPIGVVYWGDYVARNCNIKYIETLTLKSLDSITNLEFKLLTMRREAIKLENFICSLKSKVLTTLSR